MKFTTRKKNALKSLRLKHLPLSKKGDNPNLKKVSDIIYDAK